jgi:hypothetical protein
LAYKLEETKAHKKTQWTAVARNKIMSFKDADNFKEIEDDLALFESTTK